MSQGNLILPTVGVVGGLTMTQDTNAALLALATANSGASAPTNATGGAPVEGQFWGDTSVAGQLTLKQYSGSAWVIIGVMDVTNGIWTPPIAGGIATTISSATTTDLGSKPSAYVTVSGTVTITGLGSSAVVGSIKVVRFSGILILTYNASSLILPTAANITTAAGDVGWFAYEGSGNWRCVAYQLASGAALNVAAVGASSLVASAQGMNAPLNLRINATVSANALTVAVKTAANADASAGSPVLVPFRDATIANGDPVILALQAALSFTVASTNTLGAVSGNVPFRLWVIAYYNGGTLAVGLFNASSSAQQTISVAGTTAIYPLPEGSVVTTAASTNGGNNAGTHYANVSTITNTPFRIIGFLDWASGLTTAGTWASGPTTIQLFGPGNKRPGDLVQSSFAANGLGADGTTAVSASSLVFSSTQGDQYLSASMAPTSPCNLFAIDTQLNVSAGGNTIGACALFQSGSTLAVAGQVLYLSANQIQFFRVQYYGLCATSTSVTWTVREGNRDSYHNNINGYNAGSSQLLAGFSNSFLRIEERMG